MQFLLHILITIGHILPVALGYNLVFGKAKLLHFGPLGVSLIAAYSVFLPMTWGYGWTVSILISILLCSLLALLFTWLAVRLTPDGFGVMTIALHLICLALILNGGAFTRGALGIPRIPRFPFASTQEQLALLAVVMAIFWLVVFLLTDRSRLGRKLAALAEHEWHASSMGIRRWSVIFIAFLLLSLAQVWANTLYPQYLLLLYPTDYQFPAFIFTLMIVVAGKPGNVWGVTLATILLVLLREGMRFIQLPADMLGPLRLIIFGVILLAAVYVRRDTLFPPERKI